jgi:SAM-dependent methyltransferase
MSESSRESSEPAFWDVRYAREDHLFGTAPSAFVMAHAHRIPRGCDVLELGAGEGRSLLALAEKRDTRGTVLDFSEAALASARDGAEQRGVDLETICADVRTWSPDRTWDAVIVTFVQLLPDERQRLYQTIRSCLRPGGWMLGQWFRPQHLSGAYDRVGPNRMDRMVSTDELEDAFAGAEHILCEATEVTLNEGRLHGHAATAHLVLRVAG